jgi:hypothetical protein
MRRTDFEAGMILSKNVLGTKHPATESSCLITKKPYLPSPNDPK